MARPHRYDQAATRPIVVRVTPKQHRHLLRVASDNQTNVSSVIREAVNEYVADYSETAVFRIPKP